MATLAERQEQLPKLRTRFATTLSLADDASFLRTLWALNALQTGRADEASRFIGGYPAGAATEGILDKNAIHPWDSKR